MPLEIDSQTGTNTNTHRDRYKDTKTVAQKTDSHKDRYTHTDTKTVTQAGMQAHRQTDR